MTSTLTPSSPTTGLPHPSLFPFAGASVSVYTPDTDLKHGVVPPASEQMTLAIPKTAPSKGALSLDATMQYANSMGLPELREWLHAFTRDVLSPAYANFEILLHEGNTAAWAKVCRLLLDRGDYVLLEEFSFPSAMGPWVPEGCKGVPVKMDGQGLRADDLERVLAEWETAHPGERRPRVLYTVPQGANPTGTTMSPERMRDVYDVCRRFDVIVCEDAPYHALSFRPFQITPEPVDPVGVSGEEFRRTLPPSFLKYDTEGRVIRLETFSKVCCGSLRLPCASDRERGTAS